MDTVTAVKERPLLMRGPLVVATLEDWKTETRRLRGLDEINESVAKGVVPTYDGCDDDGVHVFSLLDSYGIRCPYGVPGDRLWVREAYKPQVGRDGHSRGRYAADAEWFTAPTKDERHPGQYLTNGRTVPNIHMPRWASRLLLEITDIQVQRLQEITVPDIKAEGVIRRTLPYTDAIAEWIRTWDEINGDRFGWEVDPFVWVVKYKRLKTVV